MKKILILLLLLTVLTGYSQNADINLLIDIIWVHYPSDVLMVAVVGAGSAYLYYKANQ